MIGISTYNVVPFDAGQYFNKIQCFCFEEQLLNPHEEVSDEKTSYGFLYFYALTGYRLCSTVQHKSSVVDILLLSFVFENKIAHLSHSLLARIIQSLLFFIILRKLGIIFNYRIFIAGIQLKH